MQQDDFYNKIQEKLSLLETNSDWNKDAVWNRINRQEDVKLIPKSNRWVYFGAAASVAIFAVIGLIVFNSNNNQLADNQPIIKEKTAEKPLINQINKVELPLQTKEISKQIDSKKIEIVEPQVIENNIEYTPEIKEIAQNLPVEKEIIPSNQITHTPVVETHIEETSKPNIEDEINDKRPTKQNSRVVVLNIPVAEEENDRGAKKKSLVGKIFKKDGLKHERNDKIWAFVKESFKNDSIDEKKDTVR